MKNIVRYNTKVECYWCGKLGYFTTEMGVTYDPYQCPLCEWPCYETGINDDISYYLSDNAYKYCDRCSIIYQIGCKHNDRGVDSISNAHLISMWRYKGELYIGMPQFQSIDELNSELRSIEILEMCCPNKGLICKHTNTPISSDDCELNNCFSNQLKNIIS